MIEILTYVFTGISVLGAAVSMYAAYRTNQAANKYMAISKQRTKAMNDRVAS